MAEYNREKLMGALRKADAAGDEDAARAIARKIKSLEPQAEPEQPSMGAGEAFKEGAIQGASFGLSDEALAATETGKQVLQGAAEAFMKQGLSGVPAALSGIQENYRENVRKEREVIAEAAKDHPMAFLSGDIAGSIGSTLATLGLGKAVHGAKVMKTAGGLLGTHASVGFAHGVGRSEDQTIEGMLQEGKEGAIMGVAGELAGPFMGAAGKQLANKVESVIPKHFVKFLGGNIDNMGESEVSKVMKVLNYTDDAGAPLVRLKDSRKVMADKVDMARQAEGAKMGAVLKRVDDDLKLELDPQIMHDDIFEHVLEPLMKEPDPDQLDAAARGAKYLKRLFFDAAEEVNTIDPKTGTPINTTKLVNKKLTLQALNNVKSRIFNDSRGVARTKDLGLIKTQRIKEAIADRLGDHIDTVVANSGEMIGEDLIGAYAAAKSSYGPLKETGRILEARLQEDAGKSFVQKLFNDGFVRFTSLAGVLGASAGIPYSKVALAGAGLKMVYDSKAVNGVVAKSAKVLHDTMNRNPQKFEEIASRLIQASAISGDAFVDEMSSASAQVDLINQPLARSSAETIRRKDSILSLIDSIDSAKADQLRKAIARNDEISIQMLMSEITAVAPIGLVQEGIGWDGKAITEADKAKINNMITGIKSTRKRMHLSSKFNKDFKIPEELFKGTDDPINRFVYRKRKDKVKNPRY